jgi:hypothetical protein
VWGDSSEAGGITTVAKFIQEIGEKNCEVEAVFGVSILFEEGLPIIAHRRMWLTTGFEA